MNRSRLSSRRPARDVTALMLGAALAAGSATDVPAPEAVSRELAALLSPNLEFHREAVTRELSLFLPQPDATDADEAVSRELSLFLPRADRGAPAITRELSLFLPAPGDSSAAEAISRELTLQLPESDDDLIHPEAVSRELSLYRPDPADLRLALQFATNVVAEGFTIAAIVTRFDPPDLPLTVYLNSSSASLLVPDQVVIPARSNSWTFAVLATDDTLIAQTRAHTVTASASNHENATAGLTVLDDDLPRLTLTAVPESFSEGAGGQSSTLHLRRQPSSPRPLVVQLNPGNPTALILPLTATIPAFAEDAYIPVTAVNNDRADGPSIATITAIARVTGGLATIGPDAQTTVTVTDDDGPALVLLLERAVLPEGSMTTATVRRSRSAVGALNVNLTTSDTNAVSLPASVVLPDGRTDVSFPVTSTTNSISDRSRVITLSATAPGHSSAAATLIVADVLWPDLVLTEVAAPATAYVSERASLSFRVENQGLAPLTNAILQRVFLSRDALVGDDILVGTFAFTPGPNGMASGLFFGQSVPSFAFTEAGDYWVVVVADVEGAATELSEANNAQVSLQPIRVQPDFTAIVSADLPGKRAVAGTPVPLRGNITVPPGRPRAGKRVDLHLTLREFPRVISAITDDAGNFETVFRPLPGEAGRYTVGAARGGESIAPVQDEFTLLGATLEPGSLELRIDEGSSLSGRVTLRNLSDQPLSGLSAAVLGSASGLTFNATLSTDTLTGNNALDVNYVLTANLLPPSARTDPPRENFTVRIVSSDRTTNELPVRIVVEPKRPRLISDPPELVAGMVLGGQKLVEFHLVNAGRTATGPLTVALPVVPWLSLAVTNPLPSMEPGTTNTVTLSLTPQTNLALGPYTGQIGVTGGNAEGASLAVPFTFRALSEGKGGLRVIATDEFTYYAEGAPRVTNATVTVRDALTGTNEWKGVTDANGEFLLAAVMEGYYEVEVSALEHGSFLRKTFVSAGPTNEISAFLPRELVRYSWTVDPTEVGDRTRIVIETIFETVVPAPVVTMEPALIDLRDWRETEMMVELAITNHGLIAAQQASLYFAKDSEYHFEPLVETLGDLPARSSLRIPLKITRRSLNAGRGDFRPAGTGSGGPCVLEGGLQWSLVCGERQSYFVPTRTLPARFCAGGETSGFSTPRSPFLGIPSGGSSAHDPTYAGPFWSWGIDLCDECLWRKVSKGLKCVFDCIPIPLEGSECIGPAEECANAFRRDGSGSAFKCIKDGVKCVLDAGGGDTLLCVLTLLKCYGEWPKCTIGGPGGFGGGGPIPHAADAIRFQLENNSSSLDAIEYERDRVRMALEPAQYFLGSQDWQLHADAANASSVINLLFNSLAEDSDLGIAISAGEDSALHTLAHPEGITPTMVEDFIARWNRTSDYFSRGWISALDVPPGFSTNFIALDTWTAVVSRSLATRTALRSEGYTHLTQALEHAARQTLDLLRNSEGGGVCSKVRLRLEQEAVLARSAFRASLELENRDSRPLTGLQIDLRIRTAAGVNATEFFGVRAPELTAINAVDGTGILTAQTTGSAAWILIPTLDAAPGVTNVYLISGTLRFAQNGTAVTIPLAEVPITVYPGPELVVDYFHERDVFSDDPFTEVLEPSIPYSLGVMVRNVGRGEAHNFRITSGQPQIVENEKGLLIDFNLIATEVAGLNLNPSLTAAFGDIPAGTTAVGRWLFTSTLQGLFLDYRATFEHLDAIAGRRLSIITNVTIHEMIHLVRADRELDDGQPDFLVNDVPDVFDRPDTLYLSDGTRLPVSSMEAGTAGTPSPSEPVVTLHSALPAGWVYLRIPEPSDGRMRLVNVRRADGTSLRRENSWVTDRTFIGLGRRPIRENMLHLVDRDSAGRYTLHYETLPAPDLVPPASQVAPLPGFSYERIALSWTAQDEPGGSGVAGVDLWVSENDGPPRLWLARAASSGAIFPGQMGRRYTFYSVASDREGNREIAPSVPDAFTTVNLTNRPPALAPIEDQAIDEGETLTVQLQAHDPDLPSQVLTYQLAGKAPPGLVIDSSSGRLTWPTGEGNGPGTNLVTVRVFDQGFPSLTNTRTFQVVVRELNSPPELVPVPNFKVNEGQWLIFTNQAADRDLPAQELRFSLGTGAPIGASIDPITGVFRWRPNDRQGGTTNRLAVEVAEAGPGVLKATREFTVIVRNSSPDFVVNLGGTHVLSGQSGDVSVSLRSGLALTNLSLSLLTPGGRLKNLALSPAALELNSASVFPEGPDRAQLHLSASGGQSLQGDLVLAQLHFDTTSERASTIVPLRMSGLRATLSGGDVLTNGTGFGERVFVIGDEPILEARIETDLTRTLVLYGQPGRRYQIEQTSTLGTGLVWQPRFDVDLSDASWLSPPLTEPTPEMFYRALRSTPPQSQGISNVTRLSDGRLQFRLAGRPEHAYVIEASTNLVEWHPVSTNLAPVNFTIPIMPAPSQRFFRLQPPP